MATARGNAINTAIGADDFAPCTTGNQKVLLSTMVTRGICTAAGAYAGGKSQTDLEHWLAAPDPVTEMMNDVAKVIYQV